MSVRTEAEYDYEIVNKRIRPIAERLIEKYDELRHIDPDKILFIVNHKSAGSKKQMTLAKTTKVPPKWIEILYQLGSCSYFYMVEFYAKTTAAMDEAQLVALVYRELRRIGPEGDLLSPDVAEWYQVLMGLGRKWFYPDATCPNLLDDSAWTISKGKWRIRKDKTSLRTQLSLTPIITKKIKTKSLSVKRSDANMSNSQDRLKMQRKHGDTPASTMTNLKSAGRLTRAYLTSAAR